MAISSIGGVAPEAQAASVNSLGQEEFMKILLTQLTYQDPLKPLDNQEFIAQLAQFSSLEQSRQLNSRVDTLLTIQSTTQAVALLNKTVEINTPNGPAVGTVTTLTFREGQPFMTIKTANDAFINDVTLAQISVVR
jgi:flagellar basal-body rod modification protein FlgD